MSIALIARADNGGLGTLTWEFWRHLNPERTLIVDFGRHTRVGPSHRERYHELTRRPGHETFVDGWEHSLSDAAVSFVTGPGITSVYTAETQWERGLSDAAVSFVTAPGITSVYTAETWYDERIPILARDRGIRRVIHVMPEWWNGASGDGAVCWNPTDWQLDTLQRVPVPVARDRLPFRPREAGAATFYHPGAPTAHDRNGTNIVRAALPHVTRPCRFIIRNWDAPPGSKHDYATGEVDVEELGPYPGPYFEAWPKDADILVLPRRFGGLSLPMQEAASLGMPIVTTNLPPQNAWASFLVPTNGRQMVRMTGGNIPVYDVDAVELAGLIDYVVDHPDDVYRASISMNRYADSIAWHRWADLYRLALT